MQFHFLIASSIEDQSALVRGIGLVWQDVYDFVNSFGDYRGNRFNSVWTFDLNKDILILNKKDRISSVPLDLARKQLLTLADFMPPNHTEELLGDDEIHLPAGPYWKPELDLYPRERSFLGHMLRDFGYTWRHVLRRQMNTTTFLKLAYAVIWILTLEFSITDRVGFEHVSDGGIYVDVTALPNWDTPQSTFFQMGSCWLALAQDASEGLKAVRHHMSNGLATSGSKQDVRIYIILTLQHVILCKADGEELVWTKPETLFDMAPASGTIVGIVPYITSEGKQAWRRPETSSDRASASDTAIDMILWAINTSKARPRRTTINLLPVEIQNKILHYTGTSPIASAKLGCKFGLGSPFTWVDRHVKIGIEDVKRHRGEDSPVESQIIFNGAMSGLSYKRELTWQPILY